MPPCSSQEQEHSYLLRHSAARPALAQAAHVLALQVSDSAYKSTACSRAHSPPHNRTQHSRPSHIHTDNPQANRPPEGARHPRKKAQNGAALKATGSRRSRRSAYLQRPVAVAATPPRRRASPTAPAQSSPAAPSSPARVKIKNRQSRDGRLSEASWPAVRPFASSLACRAVIDHSLHRFVHVVFSNVAMHERLVGTRVCTGRAPASRADTIQAVGLGRRDSDWHLGRSGPRARQHRTRGQQHPIGAILTGRTRGPATDRPTIVRVVPVFFKKSTVVRVCGGFRTWENALGHTPGYALGRPLMPG